MRNFSRYEGIFRLPRRGSGKSKGGFFEEIFEMMFCDALFLIYRSLSKKIKAQKEENKAIKDGLLAILHDRLYQACTHYIEIGHIDLPGLKNIEYLYKSYHALGGNGTGTELYTRAKALPIRED